MARKANLAAALAETVAQPTCDGDSSSGDLLEPPVLPRRVRVASPPRARHMFVASPTVRSLSSHSFRTNAESAHWERSPGDFSLLAGRGDAEELLSPAARSLASERARSATPTFALAMNLSHSPLRTYRRSVHEPPAVAEHLSRVRERQNLAGAERRKAQVEVERERQWRATVAGRVVNARERRAAVRLARIDTQRAVGVPVFDTTDEERAGAGSLASVRRELERVDPWRNGQGVLSPGPRLRSERSSVASPSAIFL